jgi:ketosteroid isomerase-like protein
MTRTAALLGLAALAWSAAAQADAAADIRAQEAAWEQAIRAKDYAKFDVLLAPEFRLMRAENGRVLMTSRAQWFAALAGYTLYEFEVRVVDVAAAGNSAVATVEGRWKVGVKGRGIRDESFILSDTWVRRRGQWQVLYRHSTPGPRK